MVFHPNDEDGAALLIDPAVSVLAGSVDFVNDFLLLGDGIWLEALVPLHPVFPHFVHLVFLELSCDAEPGDGVDVGVEIPPVLQLRELRIENLDNLLLLRFDLGQLAVADTHGVIRLHLSNLFNYYYQPENFNTYFIIQMQLNRIFFSLASFTSEPVPSVYLSDPSSTTLCILGAS